MEPTEVQVTDGRLQRSKRSREAIVNALYDLVGEGVLAPTAQQVAERAGVGVRTVFRQFSDMETLFSLINDRIMSEVSPLFADAQQAGPLAQRIRGLVENRANLYGIIAPYRRTSDLQRWRSAFLTEQIETNNRRLRRDLRQWLPEIENLDADAASAIDAVLSFEYWDRLRTHQKLSAKRAAATIERTLSALMA